MNRIGLLLTLMSCFVATAVADDWPASASTGQGYCSEKKVPFKWSKKENVKWKVPLEDPGNSTPIVWKGKIFLAKKKGGSVRNLLCFDRTDGKELWRTSVKYADKERNWTPDWYCNASPVTDGERIIVSFGSAGMYCYDFDGELLWKRTDLGKWEHQFGNSSSPIIYGDLAILWCGPNENKGRNFLLAVDKKTGKTVWEKDEKSGSWVTPTIVKVDGHDRLLYCADFKLKSVDPKDGKELWFCDGLTVYVYTSPLYSPKLNIAVAMSGYNGSDLAVKLGGTGNITKDRLWNHPKNIRRSVGSGIIVEDHVYILEENGMPHCYDLESGKEVWHVEKRPGPTTNWGSMVQCGDKLYVLTRDADTLVFAASPKYKLLATNKIGPGETTNSSLAISNGEIFIRTNQSLWCISEKK